MLAALRSVRRAVRGEAGCCDAFVGSDAEDGTAIWYYEEWANEERFERHVRSARFAHVLAVVEMAAETPRIECRVISETRGLKYLAGIRGVEAVDADAGNHR